jgi:hypothetical protein
MAMDGSAAGVTPGCPANGSVVGGGGAISFFGGAGALKVFFLKL